MLLHMLRERARDVRAPLWVGKRAVKRVEKKKMEKSRERWRCCVRKTNRKGARGRRASASGKKIVGGGRHGWPTLTLHVAARLWASVTGRKNWGYKNGFKFSYLLISSIICIAINRKGSALISTSHRWTLAFSSCLIAPLPPRNLFRILNRNQQARFFWSTAFQYMMVCRCIDVYHLLQRFFLDDWISVPISSQIIYLLVQRCDPNSLLIHLGSSERNKCVKYFSHIHNIRHELS